MDFTINWYLSNWIVIRENKVDSIPHTTHQDKPQMNQDLNVKNNH